MTTESSDFLLGKQAIAEGRGAAAVEYLARALKSDDQAAVRISLIDALDLAGQRDESKALLEQSLRLFPADAKLWRRKISSISLSGRISEAFSLLDEAEAAVGDLRPFRTTRAGLAFQLTGEIKPNVAVLETCLSEDPTNIALVSNILYADAHVPELDAVSQKAHQRSLAGHFTQAQAAPTAPWDGQRKLRIGYVSGAFYFHAGSRVSVPFIGGHDRGKFHIVCYSSSRNRDARSYKLRFMIDGWRQINALSDAEAAALVRADGIDILVDLDGHTGGNRLGLFALRPAPVQLSAWGYLPGPGTPGIDYLVSDTTVAPLGERAAFHERIIDVPCPTAMAAMDETDVPQSPAPDRMQLGVFARSEKVSSQSLDVWAEVLRARRHATLSFQGGYYTDPVIAARVRGALTDRGVLPQQIEILPTTGVIEFRQRLGTFDLVFDTFPYSGGVVTLDALSQGTPVLTWHARHLSARTTESILRDWDLDELVAPSPEAFAPMTIALIDDTARRADLRRRIRATTRRFDSAYFRRTMAAFEEQVMNICRHL